MDECETAKIFDALEALLDETRAAQRQHGIVEQLLDVEIGMDAAAQAKRDIDAIRGEIRIAQAGGDARIDLRNSRSTLPVAWRELAAR